MNSFIDFAWGASADVPAQWHLRRGLRSGSASAGQQQSGQGASARAPVHGDQLINELMI